MPLRAGIVAPRPSASRRLETAGIPEAYRGAMTEFRPDGDQETVRWSGPAPDPPRSRSAPEPPSDGPGGGSPSRLWVGVALTVVAVVVVAVVVVWSGLLGQGGGASASPAPSVAVVLPTTDVESTPSVAPSVVPSALPLPSTAVGPGPSPRPVTAPTSPGLIAVVSDEGVLSTMDDGGGSRVSYPAPGAVLGFPAWSPDGSQIAVIGAGANDTSIYVFDVPGAGATTPGATSSAKPIVGPDPVVIYRSRDRAPFYLYWTPDGRKVGFLATEAVGLGLRIAPADGSAPLDGSGPAALIRQGSPLYFDWIDAKRLLLHVDVGSNAFTGEVGLDGKSIKPALKGSGIFRSAIVSHDGHDLAYVRSETDGSEKLVVASRDGSASHETAVFGPAAFAFDPAGDGLASVASKVPVDPGVTFPFGPLRLTDPRTGKVRTLLEGPVVAFFWSPDGRTIAAIVPSHPGDLPGPGGTADIPAGTGVPSSSPGAVPPVAGVTGRLAFVDVATGVERPEQVVQLNSTFVNQLLPYFDQYALSHRLWSPDSASILLPLVDAAGRNQLVAIPAAGSDARPVAGGANGFWSP